MKATNVADAPYPETAASIESGFGPAQDFEQLLTKMVSSHSGCDLSVRTHCKECQDLETQMYYLRRALIEFFTQIRNNAARAYERFSSEILNPGDCVITFNYDVSLDRELYLAHKWNVSDGYGFSFPSNEARSPVKLLKLHGSSNWYAKFHGAISGYGEGAQGANYLWRPVITPSDMDFLGYTTCDPLFGNGAGCPPLIVLPVPSKNFYLEFTGAKDREMSQFFDSLWFQAQKGLGMSDEIVICGYSMPDADEKACKLLLQKANKDAQVRVVSGGSSESVVQRFTENGFHSVQKIPHRRFEEWVECECASPCAC
jgi:hypothetical protein